MKKNIDNINIISESNTPSSSESNTPISTVNEFNNNDPDKDYKFVTNVSKRLSEILEIPEFNYDDNFTWEPPKKSGLSNCQDIIPKYYKIPHNKIINLDYYEIIKDYILNFRALNQYQIDYILNLENTYKDELLLTFNKCLDSINDLMLK